MPAEQLAELVLDQEEPGTVNLAKTQNVFKQPREAWDKVLSSPSFEQVSEAECQKLQLFVSGASKKENFEDLTELGDKADSALFAEIPELKWISKPRGWKREGRIEIIMLASLSRKLIRSFAKTTNYDDAEEIIDQDIEEDFGGGPSTVAKDPEDSEEWPYDTKLHTISKMGEMEERLSFAIQILGVNRDFDEIYLAQEIKVNRPVAYYQNEKEKDYFVQGQNHDILFFTTDKDKSSLCAQVLSHSTGQIKQYPVEQGCHLQTFLQQASGIDLNQSEDGEASERSKLIATKYFKPLLLNPDGDDRILAYNQIDSQYESSVHLFNLALGREVAVVRGAQTLLCQLDLNAQ